MKRNATTRRSIHVLRWVFQRGNRLVTCQLEREGRQASYILSLVPHWDVRQTVTSTFDAAAGAFRGHASVVDHLRSEGWTLASYTVAP